MYKIRIYLWCLLSAFQFAFSQVPYSLEYNTENGLPSLEVYDVAFDKEGRAWFPTDRGLGVYNGYEFKVYTTQEGLTNNTVLEIVTAPNGDLWFLGLDGKLSHQKGDSIFSFVGNEQIPNHSNRNLLIIGIAWDQNGRIIFWQDPWIYQVENFFRWDPISQKLETLDFKCLTQEYGYQELPGLRYIDLSPYPIPEIPLKEFKIFDDGRYFYNQAQTNGVLKYGNRQLDSLNKEPPFYTYIHDVMWEDEFLWVCTSKGLIRVEDPMGVSNQTTFFPNLPVSNLGKDPEGNYWVTTLNAGVKMVPSLQFDIPRPYPGADAKATVLELYPMGDHLLTSTMEGDLIAVDTLFQSSLILSKPGLFGSLQHAFPGPKGAFFLNHQVFETTSGIDLQTFPLPVKTPYTIYINDSTFFALGLLQQYWMKFKRGSWQRTMSFPAKTGRVQTILKTDSCLWIGTLKGLHRLDYPNGPAPSYPVTLGPEIDQQRINDLVGTSTGTLFAATVGNGLAIVDQGKVFRFGKIDGLSSNMVNQLALENDSTVWLATNQGLTRITLSLHPEPGIKKVITIGAKEGLPGNYTREVAVWNQQVWASTNAGLVHFDPERILRKKLYAPQVRFKSIRVNRHEMTLDSLSDLKHDQNNLTFDFQAISYSKPSGLPFYRHRLLPLDTNWNYTQTRQVQVWGLPAGAYTFEVEARTSLGNWPQQPQSCSFYIHPHYAETLWFRGLMGMLILTFIGGVWFVRSRQVRARNEQRRSLQAARLQARESELAALRNQMNPHFVFDVLNSIQTFIFRNDAPKASYYMGRFARLMRDGLEFSLQNQIPLIEELAFLKAYLELESLRFPNKFSYHIHIPENLEVEAIKLPPFLFQPILENAIKHGFKEIDYPGKLEINIERHHQSQLKISIIDNGGGLHRNTKTPRQKSLYPSRGLKIVRNQIELINTQYGKAEFVLQNRAPGPGTEAIFIFTPS